MTGDVVTLQVNGARTPPRAARPALPIVQDVTVFRRRRAAGSNVFDGAESLPALLRVLDHAGVTMHSINLSRPTLDDVSSTDDRPVAAARLPRALADSTGLSPSRRARRKQGVTDMTFIHDTLIVFRRQHRLNSATPPG